jgi:hypothetical protein
VGNRSQVLREREEEGACAVHSMVKKKKSGRVKLWVCAWCACVCAAEIFTNFFCAWKNLLSEPVSPLILKRRDAGPISPMSIDENGNAEMF